MRSLRSSDSAPMLDWFCLDGVSSHDADLASLTACLVGGAQVLNARLQEVGASFLGVR